MRLAGPLTPVPEGRGQRKAWTPGSDEGLEVWNLRSQGKRN